MHLSERDSSLRALRDDYLDAQLRGNRREALRVITEQGLARGVQAHELQEIIREAQQEIGRLWQEDRISVAEEHVATAISQVALSHVYQHAEQRPLNGKKVLVACVEGELHDFPSRLVADALDLSGFEVRFVGASVPVTSLLDLVHAEQPDLLALSVTMTFNVPKAREAVQRVREQTGGKLPIALGGGACAWSKNLAQDLGVEVTGCSARELVEQACAYLGVKP